MKKIILLLLSVLYINGMWAVQVQPNEKDSLINDICSHLNEIRVDMLNQTLHGNFKIYLTENIYNVLKLNTSTGQIDVIQWHLEKSKEMSIPLNSTDLSLYQCPGTFELYPTKNMYQFLLLDKTTGRVWHVQWGFEDADRWIRRIY